MIPVGNNCFRRYLTWAFFVPAFNICLSQCFLFLDVQDDQFLFDKSGWLRILFDTFYKQLQLHLMKCQIKGLFSDDLAKVLTKNGAKINLFYRFACWTCLPDRYISNWSDNDECFLRETDKDECY
jgi:hypothetical protein